MRKMRGLTLIELMIAMAVSCVIVAGTLGMYAQVRSTWQVNERVAHMQEQGRFALSVIEPDVELAGYFGFSNTPESIRLIHGGNANAVLATSEQMRQTAPRIGGLPPASHACGTNFAVAVATPVQGSNDAFVLGPGATCTPYRNRAQPGADTLTVRRAETQASAAEANHIQIYASRLTSQTGQLMFSDGHAPGATDEDHRIHNFIVRTYYVARDSVGQNNFPALRVKTLTNDEEVMPGVEDLQLQFGIDDDKRGQVTRYVDPGSPDLSVAQVVSVRVWLRIRSEDPKPEHMLMSRTIAVRNARWS